MRERRKRKFLSFINPINKTDMQKNKLPNYFPFFLLVFVACVQFKVTANAKPSNAYKFKGIENKGIHGIVGKNPVDSTVIDSSYYRFTYKNKKVQKIQAFFNGKSVLFPCPSFCNPFDTALLSSIEYQYFNKQTTAIMFFGPDKKIIFRETIEGDSMLIVRLASTGALSPNDSGVAKTILKYDSNTNLVELRQYDGFSKITTGKKNLALELYFEDPLTRAAIKKWKYLNGKKIEQRNYYDDGRLWDFISWKYDSMGNVIEEAYFDEKGNPKPGNQNWARVEYGYDVHKNKVSECVFDEFGKPTYNALGGSCIEWEHYASGQVKQVKIYDTNRQLREYEAIVKFILDANGEYWKTYKYDRNGLLVDSIVD